MFYETDSKALHARHRFSSSSTPNALEPTEASIGQEVAKTPLKVVAMDCEMIYTTAGMSVARVSIVNEVGDIVYDQLVKPDDGVVAV